MSLEIKFTQTQINQAKWHKTRLPISKSPTPRVLKKERKIFKCSIDGYFLRIGKHKVTKGYAIKFAKWILKSFNHDNNINNP